MVKKLFCITGIRQVTPPLSCNIKLFAGFFIFFGQTNPRTLSASRNCRHHTCSPGAYYNYIIHHLLFCTIHLIKIKRIVCRLVGPFLGPEYYRIHVINII